LRQLVQNATKRYQDDAAKAEALLSVGDSKSDSKCAPAELAAWTVAASEIMNLDESLTK